MSLKNQAQDCSTSMTFVAADAAAAADAVDTTDCPLQHRKRVQLVREKFQVTLY